MRRFRRLAILSERFSWAASSSSSADLSLLGSDRFALE
jgi:hypothetical protein